MKFLSDKQKTRIYVLLVLLILIIGIFFRLAEIDKRVLFTDEAVHYSKILGIYQTQPYKYEEVIKYKYIDTINIALNAYNYFDKSLEEKNSIWQAHSFDYKDQFNKPPLWLNINNIFQPYFYAKHLINNNDFRYDPVYHGPFQYYLGDLFFNLKGEYSIYLLRLPMALASVLSLFFVFLFIRYLGKKGLLISLLLIAVSPGLVYFSNLANYEDYISSFNILGVGLLLIGIQKRNPWILLLSGVTLLTLMTIKETALVAWFCIVVALILTYFVLYIKTRPSKIIQWFEDLIINFFDGAYTKSVLRYLFPALICFTIAGIIFVVLYSSFGAYPAGVHDGLTSWMYWKNTGANSGHVKSFYYYTDLIFQYDFLLVFMFLSGGLFALYQSNNRYIIFIVFWSFTLWLVYSYIPYKTPWLIINFLLPFAITAGVGWNLILEMADSKVFKVVALVLFVIMSINMATLSVELKWFRYDDPENELTYVHTYREFEEQIMAIYTLTQASTEGKKIEISIALPEYWPLPAYLFDYKSLGYFNGVRGRSVNINAPIIINDKRDNPELREYMLESDVNDYLKLRDFHQRPGVDTTIFVKEHLLKRYIDGKYYTNWVYDPDRSLLKEPTRD